MSGRRAGASAVVFTLLAVGVLLLMVMFAARSGPQRIFTGPLHDPNFAGGTPTIRPYTPPVLQPGSGGHVGARTGMVFDAIGWAIRLAILLSVLWLLRKVLLAIVDSVKDLVSRRRPKAAEHVDFDVLDDPDPLVQEMREDADEQLELLLGGHPRNAIVACWDRFEEQAERVGLSRQPWETSSEFVLRLLDQVSADEAAVSRLELLYHEARFSRHEIDESRRQSAVEALRAIHASLGIGATR